MSISETLGGFYEKAEEAFFNGMDFLEEKGIPVYAVIDPLEEKGVPVFPATMAVLVVLVLLLAMLLTSGGSALVVTEFKDQRGAIVNGVTLSVYTENDDLLVTNTLNSGDSFSVQGVPLGTNLYGRAIKEGYQTATVQIPIKSREGNLVLVKLQKNENLINAIINLRDSVTDTKVKNASVTAVLRDGTEINCFQTEDGIFECQGLIEGEDALIVVESPNYETMTITKSFSEGSSIDVALTPTSASFTGNSSVVIKAFDKDTREIISDVKVDIYKGQETEPITSVVAPEGEYIESIPKGNILRIVVSKDGYVAYDSVEEEDFRTLREGEEVFEAYLKKGADSIEVFLSDQTGAPLANVVVSLFDEQANILSAKDSGFGGNVSFDDVNGDRTYYLTAFKEGFLPERILVEPNKTSEYQIELIPKTASNSAVVEVTAIQSDGRPANTAAINFYEIVDGEKLPLGLPQGEADLDGTYLTYSPLHITMLVEAIKDPEFGEEEKEIEVGRNEIFIYMAVAEGMVKINLVDEYGKEITDGHVTITTASGDVLYDGDINSTNGIWVYKGDSKRIRLHYESPDGKVYDEEINVDGKSAVEIEVTPQEPEGLAPKIEFLGMFTAADKEMEAVTKGTDYYAKFSVQLPQGGYESGVHIRVGSDDVKNIDSQDTGIIGYSAVSVKEHFYGRTYAPSPAPGYEGIDRQNSGEPGEYNKWLELKFSGEGTKIVKVRIKAKETAVGDEFELHYRTWLEAGGMVYRTPKDSVIGEEKYSSERMGLYAETMTEQIKIFSSDFSCENDICASYKFISENGSEASPEEFKATQGKRYALEVELVAVKDLTAELKANTDAQNPKIYFIGTGINSNNFPDGNRTDTESEIKAIPLKADEKLTARIYFNAIEEGPSEISLQVATAEELIRETFSFNIYIEQNLNIKFEPEEITLGEDFKIDISDDEGKGVEDASIRFIDQEGKIIKTVTGKGRIGSNGIYEIKNNLSPGKYKVEIRREGFKPYETEINVLKTGVLVIDDEIKISIIKGENNNQTKVKVENKGNERVDNIRYEIIKDSDFPADMDAVITMPAAIEKKASQYGNITGEYAGEEERAHGEVTLRVTGTVLNTYDVVAESKLIIDYNPEYEGCLEISKERLVVYLGSNANSSKDLNLTVKNNCEGDLLLTPEAVAKGKADENIRITANSVELEGYGAAGSEEGVIINVTNTLQRNYPQRKVFTYDLRLKSDSITESVPLDVIIWNPRTMLSVNRNIEVWMAGTQQTGFATKRIPIYARNIGMTDIENLTFNISARNSKGYVNIKLLPTNTVNVLPRGASLMPPLEIEVQAGSIDKGILQDVREIDIFGNVDGQRYEFGPIIVTSHVSPPECLKAAPSNLSFKSTQIEGAISKSITVTNGCSEEVMIRAIEPTMFGTNYLGFFPTGLVLAPGSTEELQVVLHKRENWDITAPIFVKGFLSRSQMWVTSAPINTTIKLGNVAFTDDASISQTIPVCGEEENSSKDIRLPKIAISSECDSAYCDAEQLAEFIAERIKSSMDAAHNKILQANELITNTSCDPNKYRGYCPFELLDVQEEEYEVYMMNDNLTPEMLKAVIEKKAPGLKHFAVDYAEVNSKPELLLGSLGNKIYLDRALRGCGKYTLVIKGAVRVSGTHLMKDYMGVVVGIVKEEGNEVPEQCLAKISNAMNFLPWDKSYSPRNSMGSWLSITQAETEDNIDLAKKLAKQLFSSDDRFVEGLSGYHNNSRLVVRPGGSEGYIVKMNMVKNVDGPATIYADILESAETSRQNIIEEASKAIAGFKNGIIDGCISPNEDYILLKSAAGVGKLVVQGGKPIKVRYAQKSCTDLNVSADTSDTIELNASFIGTRNGIKEAWFEQKGNKINAVVLQKDEEKKKYFAQVQLCVEGLNDLQNAHGQKIKVEANSKVNTAKRATPVTVDLEVCGIHPYDLINKLKDKKKGEFYATLMWKGDRDEYVAIGDLKRMVDAFDQIENADAVLAGTSTIDPEEKLSPKELSAKRQALLWYAGACVGTEILISTAVTGFNPVAGLTKGLFDSIFDCGLPTLFGFADELGLSKITDFFKPIGDFVKNGIEQVFGAIGLPTDWLKSKEATGAAIEADGADTMGDLISGAVLGVSTRSLGVGLKSAVAASAAAEISQSAANSIAGEVSGKIMKELETKGLKGLKWPQLKDAIAGNLVGKNTADLGTAIKEATDAGVSSAVSSAMNDSTFSSKMLSLLDEPAVRALAESKAALKGASREIVSGLGLKGKITGLIGDGITVPNQAAANAAMDSVADSVADSVSRSLIDEFGEAEGKTLFSNLRTTLKNNVKSVLNSSSLEPISDTGNIIGWKIKPNTAAIGDVVDDLVTSRLASMADDPLRGVTSAATQEARKKIAEKVRKKAGTELLGKAAASADDIAREAALKKQTKWGRIKSVFRKPWAFVKGLVGGVVKGAISNAVGMWVYNWKYDGIMGNKAKNNPLVTGVDLQNVDSDYDGVPDLFIQVESDDQKLYNSSLYKVVITDNGAGKKVKFVKITELPKDIKQEELLDACNPSQFDEGVEAGMPALIPRVDVKPASISETKHARHVKAYLEKNEAGRYGALIASAVQGTSIKEELLVTVAIWKSDLGATMSEHMTGCDAKNPSTAEPMASFKCAANALDNIVDNECRLADEKAMVLCALKAYNKEPNTVYGSADDKYYEDLYVIYETWKGYRTYTAS